MDGLLYGVLFFLLVLLIIRVEKHFGFYPLFQGERFYKEPYWETLIRPYDLLRKRSTGFWCIGVFHLPVFITALWVLIDWLGVIGLFLGFIFGLYQIECFMYWFRDELHEINNMTRRKRRFSFYSLITRSDGYSYQVIRLDGYLRQSEYKGFYRLLIGRGVLEHHEFPDVVKLLFAKQYEAFRQEYLKAIPYIEKRLEEVNAAKIGFPHVLFFWRKGGIFLFYLLFVIAAPIHLSLHPSFIGMLEFLLVWVLIEILSKKKKRDFNSDFNDLTYSYVKSLGHGYHVANIIAKSIRSCGYESDELDNAVKTQNFDKLDKICLSMLKWESPEIKK